MAMLQLQQDVKKLTRSATLADAASDVDKIIDLLSRAREEIASANDPHTTSLTLTKLQNPIKNGLDTLATDIKKVHKAHSEFQKGLKNALPKTKGDLPTENDPMEAHKDLINRAIAMHLLREGQFSVASTFINEAQPVTGPLSLPQSIAYGSHSTQDGSQTPTDTDIPDADSRLDLTALQSEALQSSFAQMYSILSSLKSQDLRPAIEWTRENTAELEARGSNLEFELCKLQFIWLFKGSRVNRLPDTTNNGVLGALRYSRENFGRFQTRHSKEIQRLSGALVYSGNLKGSPYELMFDTSLAFDEVAASFTREFCSLLGLSAESPLYVAVKAGALALPQLVKYTSINKAKGTEWTTTNELAFETPLPHSMIYHPIFVCPVSKEQTTKENPPVMLQCGHVLARESLKNLIKGHRYKCPYCPVESTSKTTEEIIF